MPGTAVGFENNGQVGGEMACFHKTYILVRETNKKPCEVMSGAMII